MKINKYVVLFLILNTSFLFAQTEVKDNKDVQPVIQEAAIENTNENVPFAVLDGIPQFEACKDLIGKEGRDCFMQEMNKHIKNNFSYPQEAEEANIQGRVTVLFVINKKGEIENIDVRGPKNGELLEREAIRIMKLLPKFKPAMHRGKPVNVSYAQPIMFRIAPSIPVKE